MGHIFCSIDLKIGQSVCVYKIAGEFEFGSPKKTRSLGQIQKITCGRSRGHISCSINLKLVRMFVLIKSWTSSIWVTLGQKLGH